MMLNMITKNSLLVEEYLKSLDKSNNTTAVTRQVNNDITISAYSRSAIQSPMLENEANNDATDSRKATTSPAYGEISVKSFYGTSNVNEKILKSAVRVPIAVKASKKMIVPNRRRQQKRRSIMPRQPILGSIKANKLKTLKKLNVSATKRQLLLDENASARRKFNLLKHKQLSGKYLLKKSEKTMIESMAASAEFETNHRSNEENQQDEDELTKSFLATLEREHSIQLLSSPSNKIKKKDDGEYDEMLLIRNEMLNFVEQAFNDPGRVDGDNQLLSQPRNKVKKKENVYDELLSNRNDVIDDVKPNNPYTVDSHLVTVDQLLSPPRNKVTKKDQELLSGCNEVFDIVKHHSNNAAKVEDQLGEDVIVPIESDSLRTNNMKLSENVSLYEKYNNMIPYNTTDSDEIDRRQTVLELLINSGICNDENFKICIAEYEQNKDKAAQIINNLFEISTSSVLNEDNGMSTSIPQNDKIMNEKTFRKGHHRSHTKKDVDAPFPNKLFKWIAVSDNQVQINASEKEFGTKACGQCEMIHLPDDAEDEMLHKHFHNNMLAVLSFNGWKHENLVDTVKEWGHTGRIIWLNQTDIESRVSKIKEILEIIDNDLELDNPNLTPDSIIYLEISRKLIIGVCVAEHLNQARQMSTKNQNHNFSEICIPGKYPIRTDSGISVPVKCGVSRIWVTPQYRRYGVATRLIKAVCSHFMRGYILSVNEIAFRTPTLLGMKFAQHIADDVYVYDPVPN